MRLASVSLLALASATLCSCASLLGDFDVSASDGGAPPSDAASLPSLDGGSDAPLEGSQSQDAPAVDVARAGDGEAGECPYGVTEAGACAAFTPTGGAVTTGDLDGAGLSAFTASADPSAGGLTLVNVDTGAITAGGVTLRAQNADVTKREVISGIAYHQNAGVAIFTFGALTVPSGQSLALIGTHPVAIVSSSFMTVDGVVDATPMDASGAHCAAGVAGPGGGPGGGGGKGSPFFVSGSPGQGTGPGGGGGSRPSGGGAGGGGGGGAHAGAGGSGSTGGPGGGGYSPGPGGTAYDAQPITALHGGSGGGGGGGTSSTPSGAGGAGGGAVQLVAARTASIGGGTSPGGVNVGGCGGQAGQGGGGGGGSGGTILLEAQTVQLGAKAVLAANGGGGADTSGNNGSNATLNDQIAYGGGSNAFAVTAGGNGGAKGTLVGGAGLPISGTTFVSGYGGGGATGWIRINTQSGAISAASTAILSPNQASTGASIGTIALK